MQASDVRILLTKLFLLSVQLLGEGGNLLLPLTDLGIQFPNLGLGLQGFQAKS